MTSIQNEILNAAATGTKLLAVLIDPEKFDISKAHKFFISIPLSTTHIFVGGSTVEAGETENIIMSIKKHTRLPVVLFPGDFKQVSDKADALLFLSLISGRNPEYLIGQQLKAVPKLENSRLEIIPTGYILIDGGKETAVQQVTKTNPLSQNEVKTIVHTALAGQYSGKQLIYLEAGSGAVFPVGNTIISKVKKAINIPLIVGGGIRSQKQLEETYRAGADLVVIGTAFEEAAFIQG